MNLGSRDQCSSIKSFRRHLERKEHHKITNDSAARNWVRTGLSVIWRKAFNRNGN
jgi:hypothetical protein